LERVNVDLYVARFGEDFRTRALRQMD
jgi:hypothetical protein